MIILNQTIGQPVLAYVADDIRRPASVRQLLLGRIHEPDHLACAKNVIDDDSAVHDATRVREMALPPRARRAIFQIAQDIHQALAQKGELAIARSGDNWSNEPPDSPFPRPWVRDVWRVAGLGFEEQVGSGSSLPPGNRRKNQI